MALIKKKLFPRPSDKDIVRYVEKTKLNEQVYPLMEAIVALANTEGGRIFIGRKSKNNNGGIPEDLKKEYENSVRDCLGVIPNHVKDFPMELIDVGWDYSFHSGAYLVIYVLNSDKTMYEINWSSKISNAVFVREFGRTVRLAFSNTNMGIIRKRVKYKILKPVIAHPDYMNYNLINIQTPLEHAYKYMTLEAFTLSLLYGTWQFAEPTKWNDEYEGRFYRADYSALKVSNCPPKLFATCITGEKANEAAWKVYAHGQGLGSKCIQIKINMNKLREELSNGIARNCFGAEGAIYEGTVFYDLSDQEIDKLNETVGAYYDTFFDPFNTDSFLKLLLIKRKAYEYERETRLFFVPKDFQAIDRSVHSGKGDVINAKVNWKEIVEEIRIDKNCSQAELETIKYVCDHAHIKIHDPKKRGRKRADEIPLILFDVDKMNGRKKIKIYSKK